MLLFLIVYTVQDVQTRMATLRTQFGKLLKGKPSGSGLTHMTSRQKWIFQHLQFLKPFVLHRPSETSLEGSRKKEKGKMRQKELVGEKDEDMG